MITTPELIDSLATKAGPVKRLHPPVTRAFIWLGLAGLMLALMALVHGVRPDLATRIGEPIFLLALASSLLTGIFAAIAAFLVSLPDRSRLWMLLPLPAFFAWMSTISYGCLTQWVAPMPAAGYGGEVRCFALMLLLFVPLSLIFLLMVRYAASFRARPVTITGSLAVAGIVATGLSLFHDHNAAAIVLLWNVGVAVFIVGLSCLFGNRVLSWIAPRPLFGRP
ncbi:MAG: DUF1109 family protein [Thiobacillus sp.]|nr:DUF1109 family protein [Thiobacillus sp.]